MISYDPLSLLLGLLAGAACGFLNTAASSGSAVSLPILMMVGLDPASANATNRIPVLVGALAATAKFQASGTLDWGLARRAGLPATLGAVAGAGLTFVFPARGLGLMITAAVLIALVLLFTNLKAAIERPAADAVRFGGRETVVFLGIGVWLGFIVLDGATYLLLALTLLVGLDLARANSVKSAVLVPVTAASILVFAWHGEIDWIFAGLMGLGSALGGRAGARVAASPDAKRHVFRLLVAVMLAELVHLAWHYLFATH